MKDIQPAGGDATIPRTPAFGHGAIGCSSPFGHKRPVAGVCFQVGCQMDSEPSYLASLGEFATLKNTIGSWYHQDTYLDFATDAEIWASIWEGHDEANRSRLISQLKGVLGESDAQVLRMWNADAHSHNFVEASDAREFLMAMLAFFEGRA